MKTKPVSILLVDDDDVEAELVARSFKKRRLANKVIRAHDGHEGLKMLRGEIECDLEHPLIILLDINMPRMNGIEFLQEIRNDPNLESLVIFMLTTSNDERDRTAAYKEHVAGYIVKSRAGDDFVNLLDLIESYWTVVEMPDQN